TLLQRARSHCAPPPLALARSRRPPRPTLVPYTTLFRSVAIHIDIIEHCSGEGKIVPCRRSGRGGAAQPSPSPLASRPGLGHDRLMPILLLDRRLEPQRIDGFADQGISALDDSTALPGPAVIVEAVDSAPKAADHARESRQITGLIASRPLASREQHG